MLAEQCKKRKVSLEHYDVCTHDGQPLDIGITVDSVPEKIISLRPKKGLRYPFRSYLCESAQIFLWNGDLNITIDSARDLMQGDYGITNPCCFLSLHSESGRVFIDANIKTKTIQLTTKPFWQQVSFH